MENEIDKLNKERAKGHKIITYGSISLPLAGIGRLVYEIFHGKDLAYGREALAFNILAATVIFIAGHIFLDVDINEKIAELKKKK